MAGLAAGREGLGYLGDTWEHVLLYIYIYCIYYYYFYIWGGILGDLILIFLGGYLGIFFEILGYYNALRSS